jgi:hypothetical protein
LHGREQRLHQLPGKPGIERERLIRAFLRPPLRHTRYREGHGTLYTAVWRRAHGVSTMVKSSRLGQR